MDNPFENPNIINQEAIDALSDEQVEMVWNILTKAGY